MKTYTVLYNCYDYYRFTDYLGTFLTRKDSLEAIDTVDKVTQNQYILWKMVLLKMKHLL